tara:strand:+ start:2612 stop:3949 length:1338 start_codon:yes stop_codon:yes gene_type:complete
MARDKFDVGFCDIKLATLSHYDKTAKERQSQQPINIANFISELSFTESINGSALMGQMNILEANGLLDNFPIAGEELFNITYTDFFENEISQEFFVYNVSDAVPGKQQNYMYYTLKFVSTHHLLDMSRNVQKSYQDKTIKEMIELIFDEYLIDETRFPNSNNEIEIEDTDGVQTIVIPSLKPIAAINFLTRRSYSATNKSSNYYFYQTREKFKMKTHEQMIKDGRGNAIVYTYDPAIHADNISTRDKSMNNVLSFKITNRLNTMKEMASGAMITDVVEVDILNKQLIFNPYSYKDNVQDFTHTDKTVRFPHTNKFRQDFFEADGIPKTHMVFIDDERPNQNYAKIIAPRISNIYYHSQLTVEIEIYGRNDIFAGDIIKLNIFNFEEMPTTKFNGSLSGYWLINSISHNIPVDRTYKSTLVLSKDLALGDNSGVSTIAELTSEFEG